MPERPKGPDSKSGERYALRGFESLSLRMGHTARGVLFLFPTLLCACIAEPPSFAPMTDIASEVASDVVPWPDLGEDGEAPETALPEDHSPLPDCLTDDDCQGLAVAIPTCMMVICDAGTCVQVAASDDTPCHTETPCKDAGVCAKGICQEPDNACEDGDPCTGATCDPDEGCLYEPLDAVPCDDGDPCTATDLCAEGVCFGEGDLDCDDLNPCTLDFCNPWFGCMGEDLEGPCDDGDPCTGDDQCVYGACVGGAGACECDTDDDCAVFVNACFSAYTCDEDAEPRVCVPVPETETVCPDVAPCLAGVCNPSTGACEPVPKLDGTQCSDLLACVADGGCFDGACAGIQWECEGGGGCTAPVCLPGEGCVEMPASGLCDDGDPCTVNDWCVDGACASLGTDCAAPAPPALFRVSALEWQGPGLTFIAPGGFEVALEEALDVALSQALDDIYVPLDLLVGVAPMDTGGASSLRLGVGVCLRDDDGVVTSCPWPEEGGELDGVDYCLAGDSCDGISGAPPAPAFGVAGGSPGPLVLGGVLGGSLEATATEVAGQLQGLPEPSEITAGTLALFLLEDAAALATVSPPLMAPMPLDELLDPGALTMVDGLQGWWLHLDFEAVRTPIIP